MSSHPHDRGRPHHQSLLPEAFGNPIHVDLAQLSLEPTWGFASVKLRLEVGLVPRW